MRLTAGARELLAAVTTILDAGRAAGDLRSDVTGEDIAASLVGIFTVAPGLGMKPPTHTLASHPASGQPSVASLWPASIPSRNSLTARLDLST